VQGLNAKNMYNGCNLLRVDFSKLPELSVRFNNDKTRDFTNPLLPSGDSQSITSSTPVADQRSVALAAVAAAQQGTDYSHHHYHVHCYVAFFIGRITGLARPSVCPYELLTEIRKSLEKTTKLARIFLRVTGMLIFLLQMLKTKIMKNFNIMTH